MIEFLRINLGHRPNIISKKTLNRLFTPITEAEEVFICGVLPFKNENITSSYCLGWRRLSLKNYGDKSSLVFHYGYINGATEFVGIIPDLEVGIVILANQSSRFPLRNGLKIWKSFVDNSKARS